MPPSQSPSLRGSGRFFESPPRRTAGAGKSQSPSLRGSGRFALVERLRNVLANESQSPSLRGSGRFATRLPPSRRVARSQSPSLRGSGRFPASATGPGCCARRVLIPFIAGQWSLRAAQRVARGSPGVSQSPSLRGSGRFGRARSVKPRLHQRLNPLHCGAVVASGRRRARRMAGGGVLIPFIAGKWSLHAWTTDEDLLVGVS